MGLAIFWLGMFHLTFTRLNDAGLELELGLGFGTISAELVSCLFVYVLVGIIQVMIMLSGLAQDHIFARQLSPLVLECLVNYYRFACSP